MSEKYMSVWIWLINGIIAVTTILIMNNFLINPENNWTLKINQIPNIRIPSWHVDEIKIPVKGAEVFGRTVNDPGWKTINKLNLNQLELPPIPPIIEPKQDDEVIDVKEPTKEEALEDLQKRLRLKAVVAPLTAEAQMIDTEMEFVIVPYSRIQPETKDDILLSDEHNIYDDLTEIGLPAKCIRITIDGVYFDYIFSNSKFTKEFRLFLPIGEIVPGSYSEYEKEFGTGDENADGDDVSNGKNNGTLNETPRTDKNGNVIISRKEFVDFKNNIDKELASLGLKSVYNKETHKYEGVRVTKEPTSTLAKKYDVKKGDVIISINNHKVKSISEAKAWVQKNDQESIYTVVYLRNGVQMVKSIVPPK